MKTIGKWIAAVLLVEGLALSSAANASVVTFDFRGTGGLKPSYLFTAGGVSLDVSAGTFAGRNISDNAGVGQYSDGLGVTSTRTDAHFVDGLERNDLLIFDFGSQVQLLSVGFSYNDGSDHFRLFYERPTGGLVDYGSDLKVPGSGFYSTYAFISTWIGDYFAIGAKGHDDEFKVTSMTVDDLSPVPVPAAAMLLATSLAALGWVGRGRRRS